METLVNFEGKFEDFIFGSNEEIEMPRFADLKDLPFDADEVFLRCRYE
jgi:hypothetical protein